MPPPKTLRGKKDPNSLAPWRLGALAPWRLGGLAHEAGETRAPYWHVPSTTPATLNGVHVPVGHGYVGWSQTTTSPDEHAAAQWVPVNPEPRS
jgi:hypothetical protein